MRTLTKVYNRLKSVQLLLYPRLCALCGKRATGNYDLCPGCLSELPFNRTGCRCCALPLPKQGLLCGPCSDRAPPYERAIIPFRYAPPLDYLLQQLKFNRRLHLAPLLAELMAEAVLAREDELPQLLIPVPLSAARMRERGYNQALELARVLTRRLSVPLDWRCCRRVRHTTAQTSLSRRERRGNLRGAFAISGDLPAHVAIIDDVVTTGETVNELARTLRRAGVKRIEVWACARAG